MGETVRYLNENTSLPFKVMLPLMLAIISGTIWIQATLFRIESKQNEYITRVEVYNWRVELATKNKTLDVPLTPLK